MIWNQFYQFFFSPYNLELYHRPLLCLYRFHDLDKYIVALSNTTFIAGIEEKLSVVSITSADGVFRDLAGNDIAVTTIDAGNNLDDSKSLKIDGVPPSAFTIGSAENQITTIGNPVVPYYWNSSNTGASISLASIEDEASLVDGNISNTKAFPPAPTLCE